MNYDLAKDIYVTIRKHLIGDETIIFDVLSGCSTAYFLERGCSAMGLPPKTMVIYKPRLIWSTQSRVLEVLKKREVGMALLIYGNLYEGYDYKVVPKRFLGNMETISYVAFESRYKTNAVEGKQYWRDEVSAICSVIDEQRSNLENVIEFGVREILSNSENHITFKSIDNNGEGISCYLKDGNVMVGGKFIADLNFSELKNLSKCICGK